MEVTYKLITYSLEIIDTESSLELMKAHAFKLSLPPHVQI